MRFSWVSYIVRSKHDVKVGRSLSNGNNPIEVFLSIGMLCYKEYNYINTMCCCQYEVFGYQRTSTEPGRETQTSEIWSRKQTQTKKDSVQNIDQASSIKRAAIHGHRFFSDSTPPTMRGDTFSGTCGENVPFYRVSKNESQICLTLWKLWIIFKKRICHLILRTLNSTCKAPLCPVLSSSSVNFPSVQRSGLTG